MYLDYFDFKIAPFSLTAQMRAFFKTPQHSIILNSLLKAIDVDEFLIKVTGEVGTGKTLIGHLLAKTLSKDHNVAYLPHPCVSELDLLRALATDLGLGKCLTLSRLQLIKKLEEFVINSHSQGKRVVVILDEVQSLDDKSLEMIRILTNLETSEKKLVQVVLLGQPELDEILSQKKWRQLKQRIVHHFFLDPLTPQMTKEYISFRLFHAGHTGKKLFSRSAIGAISRISKGVPRAINVLCHRALLIAYSKGKSKVNLLDVWQAHHSDKRLTSSTYLSTAIVGTILGALTFHFIGAQL